MANLVTDTVAAGIGFVVRATKQMEDFARLLMEEGSLSKEAGSQFVDHVRQYSSHLGNDLRSEIDARVAETLKRVGLARREDVLSLERRIAELESQHTE